MVLRLFEDHSLWRLCNSRTFSAVIDFFTFQPTQIFAILQQTMSTSRLCQSDDGDGCGQLFEKKISEGLCAKCQKLSALQDGTPEYQAFKVGVVQNILFSFLNVFS